MKHFELYCVVHKEFVGMGLPEAQDVEASQLDDKNLIVNCVFKYKETGE